MTPETINLVFRKHSTRHNASRMTGLHIMGHKLPECNRHWTGRDMHPRQKQHREQPRHYVRSVRRVKNVHGRDGRKGSRCVQGAKPTLLVFLEGDQGVVLLGGEADFQNPEL